MAAVDGLSARAEVVRDEAGNVTLLPRSLRASGGGPPAAAPRSPYGPVSPRERRWSGHHYARAAGRLGLSARAEVVRRPATHSTTTCWSLRASGGGPLVAAVPPEAIAVSPRERRWSAGRRHHRPRGVGLSARAEVVRRSPCGSSPRTRSLRASGGGPLVQQYAGTRLEVSPRERRWSVRTASTPQSAGGLSARAEVVRRGRCRGAEPRGSLRASGGGPSVLLWCGAGRWVSPRERRWSGRRRAGGDRLGGLSARAEVVRTATAPPSTPAWSLRASGGGPQGERMTASVLSVSPRERRWSAPEEIPRELIPGLSARAEVVRPPRRAPPWASRSLRASGGGPDGWTRTWSWPTVSPRERRWSGQGGMEVRPGLGLSARAEVVLRGAWRTVLRCRSLRASGGGPRLAPDPAPTKPVSPRERRWSDQCSGGRDRHAGLSARAEVVRFAASRRARFRGSLRASGGGPTFDYGNAAHKLVSPRERRWSERESAPTRSELGLSARAEVVRSRTPTRQPRSRSLRASGGGPYALMHYAREGKVSPRERRWSEPVEGFTIDTFGLSARAEVVR